MGCACRGAGNWPFLGARWEPASVPAERGMSQPPFSRDPLEGGAQGREKRGLRAQVRWRLHQADKRWGPAASVQELASVRMAAFPDSPPPPPSALPSTLAAVGGHGEENNWSYEEGGRWGTPAVGMLWGGASSGNRHLCLQRFPPLDSSAWCRWRHPSSPSLLRLPPWPLPPLPLPLLLPTPCQAALCPEAEPPAPRAAGAGCCEVPVTVS